MLFEGNIFSYIYLTALAGQGGEVARWGGGGGGVVISCFSLGLITNDNTDNTPLLSSTLLSL